MTPPADTTPVSETLARIWAQAITPHLSTLIGAGLALYILSRQISDRRPAGNILAWALLVLLTPLVGTTLFLLFGVRKRGEMRRIRAAVSRVAGRVRESDAGGDESLPTRGNRVSLLADPEGVRTFEALRDGILGARQTIHITTYIFTDDATGRELLRLLMERARAGVKVRLLIDALGSREARHDLFDGLRNAGGEVARFMPVAPWKSRSSANLRNHRKLAIFDGVIAVIGGQNIDEKYTGPTPHRGRFRDFGARIEGPAVSEFTRIFASDWCFCTGCPPETLRAALDIRPEAAGDSSIAVVGGGPDFADDPIWERLVTLAAECRREIIVVTPYLVPDEVLLRLLAAKARSGKKVRVITPKKSDHRFPDFARRHHIRVLRDAGAEILFYEKGMLHGKMFLVDRTVGVLGSANLDMRSLFVNFELATVIDDPVFAAELASLADSFAECARPAKTPSNRALSFRDRCLENIARILAPLL